MSAFDYGAEAELYPSRSRGSRRQPVGYKRFDQAAEALRFAIEELPPESLVGAYMEVGEDRFDAREMRALYDAAEYPLPRNPPPQTAPSERLPKSLPADSYAAEAAGRRTARSRRS